MPLMFHDVRAWAIDCFQQAQKKTERIRHSLTEQQHAVMFELFYINFKRRCVDEYFKCQRNNVDWFQRRIGICQEQIDDLCRLWYDHKSKILYTLSTKEPKRGTAQTTG